MTERGVHIHDYRQGPKLVEIPPYGGEVALHPDVRSAIFEALERDRTLPGENRNPVPYLYIDWGRPLFTIAEKRQAYDSHRDQIQQAIVAQGHVTRPTPRQLNFLISKTLALSEETGASGRYAHRLVTTFVGGDHGAKLPVPIRRAVLELMGYRFPQNEKQYQEFISQGFKIGNNLTYDFFFAQSRRAHLTQLGLADGVVGPWHVRTDEPIQNFIVPRWGDSRSDDGIDWEKGLVLADYADTSRSSWLMPVEQAYRLPYHVSARLGTERPTRVDAPYTDLSPEIIDLTVRLPSRQDRNKQSL